MIPSNTLESLEDSPNDNKKDGKSSKTAFEKYDEYSKENYKAKEEFRAAKLRHIKNKLLTGRITH